MLAYEKIRNISCVLILWLIVYGLAKIIIAYQIKYNVFERFHPNFSSLTDKKKSVLLTEVFQNNYVDPHSVFYTREERSKPYGHAGGVNHFFYGKLPLMDLSRLTEPNPAEAQYLRMNCGVHNELWNGYSTTAQINKFTRSNTSSIPWLVSLVVTESSPENNTFDDLIIAICGGAAISGRWILTARHCFDQANPRRFSVAHRMIGNYKLFRIMQVYFHHDYNNIYNHNDVALIKLVKNLHNFNSFTPVCLPNANVIPASNRVCILMGFNGGEFGYARMKKLWVKICPPTECQIRYIHLRYNVNNNICDKITKHNKPALDKTCKGLSGSPLICNEHGRWIAYGILNWSGQDCNAGAGRGYVLTSSYYRWICSKINVDVLMQCAALR